MWWIAQVAVAPNRARRSIPTMRTRPRRTARDAAQREGPPVCGIGSPIDSRAYR
ncbi:hypothetical protein LA76x_0098 [Lysobacter antibioticus]|uniref:Uncharacterized protein n=1 Tax=Lysobacter antibioticus TaxID=84531 RepID=A0A0S2F3Z1_LYSAN|nr:hypothetical protein LA76x_0098 [Lysobacter antibioticus]